MKWRSNSEAGHMKTGFITEATKILLFAATVLITCLLVFLGFRAAGVARDISNSATVQMEQLNHDLQESDIMMFDKEEVYGSDVLNFIKKELGGYTSLETAPIYIYVKTSVSQNTYTNNANIEYIKNFSDAMYIKPTAMFQGAVVKNDNDVLIGVEFIQK